jgi:lysophospholipase L1-like esterase
MIHFRGLARRTFFGPSLATLSLAPLLASCGGGSPAGPDPPVTPTPGTPVTAVVFYDENGNGAADPLEGVRVPGVTVAIGASTGRTTSGGRVVVANVASGPQTAAARAESLPPYFVPGAPVAVQVPQAPGTEVAVPVTLPIGTNRPNVFMAFGDSITFGDGSNDGSGYRSYLEADLRSYWGGSPSVRNEGQSATRSNAGAGRIGGSLSRSRPAYTLILYGTNDWNDIACRDDRFPCYTIDSLRRMVQEARGWQSHPVLGTIIPVNPAFADRDASARNDWVRRMNEQIRALAQAERVAVADVHAAYLRQASLPPLYTDFLHPNEQGYALMAQEFLRGITTPLAATSAGRSFFFALGGPPTSP